MTEEFPIIIVPETAYERSEEEQMGTKNKFWFHHSKLGRCLYKQSRLNTGEDWAEKIAAELCKLLGLPHARYELAIWRNAVRCAVRTLQTQGNCAVRCAPYKLKVTVR